MLDACAGFLLGVLWMDLLFDVQVLRHRGGDVPDEVLASIAAYYARVTTAARPLSHLIAAVMLAAVAMEIVELVERPLPPRMLEALLLAGPIVLAVARVVPDAVRLGRRLDPTSQQAALARAVCRNHLACFASLAAFLVLRAVAGR